MLRAIITKQRAVISLIAILMVMTYVMPSGFHLSHCHDGEEHQLVTALDHADISIVPARKELETLAPALNHCCANFTVCTSEINCRPTPLRTKQTVVSVANLVCATQSVAAFLVSDSKPINHLHLQPENTSGNISVLRTIILQV